MPVTILDMIVIGVVLISALLAALRGFTREVLAIGSWAIAAAVAYMLYPQALPYAQQYVSTNKQVSMGVAIGGVFLATLLVSYFLTSKISDMILDSRIGALDRSLGFIFGAGRGLLLAVVGFIFFNYLVSAQQQPGWVKDSRLRGTVLEPLGKTLMSFMPENPEQMLQRMRPRDPADTPRDAPADPAPAPAPPRRTEAPAPPASTASTPADRAALQRVIDSGQARPQPIQNR